MSKKQKNHCLHKYRPQLRGRASVSPHMVGNEGKEVDHVVFAKVNGRK